MVSASPGPGSRFTDRSTELMLRRGVLPRPDETFVERSTDPMLMRLLAPLIVILSLAIEVILTVGTVPPS
jgi:hypothetical protein